MNQQEAMASLLSANPYFKTHDEGYKSWGKVQVLQAAIKINTDNFLLTEEKKSLEEITTGNIHLKSSSKDFFQQLFSTRKNINAILITQQDYASQLKEEVPAILDDQAQLLGVSIRRAKSESDILKAIKRRYAAVLPNGKCICIGSSLEDAFVAAQLLEKTAKVFIEAKHIGGAKPINKIEAWLMQLYYHYKYSKEAEKNR